MYTAVELKRLGVYVKGVTEPRTRLVVSTNDGRVVVRSIKLGWVAV